ncbi:hypothetical protein HD553DRAFT_352742 [Filobasidium floriforme]|uniref:uncharacterized protein n=1 Tax=Filobasidium floriforme TaxID=5210 RepID=UPI001E8EE4C6|nr:uncharacterized protein HD553DRAFT_352742 [Filobasidium floriforme]KAH8078877.1 hypothetical protein HD553DRAFT_352742 [Filobasidium floriforme]
MGQAPSTEKRPEPKTFEYGPWQVAGFLMVGTTLWMSSIDNLPPEAYGFYLMFSRATILAVVLLLCHRMYVSWAWEAEVKAWNAKQIAASKIKKVNHGETEFSRKIPFSLWDTASRAHPTFLSTSLVQPRLFPFPVGLASAENKNMVWESGLQPHVGRFQIGEAYDKKRREAATKIISERLKKEDKAKKDRGDYYTEQKRVLEHRIWHIKVLSSIAVLAFASKKLAMIALVPFMYSIFQHEMRILIEGKKSTFKAEKRPRALKQEKPSEEAPGMGLSYMYNPGEGGKLEPLQWAPILGNAPVLMTSTEPELAGDGAVSKTLPTWFKYPKASSSSKSSSSRSGGMDSMAGLSM